MLSPELKSSLDLIQDATLVHNHEEILSFPQLNIASPHMPPHHYLVDSEDEIDESEEDDYIVNDFVNDDSDDDDEDDKSKFNRPPSRLGRPLSHPYKSRNLKRNGPSVDRIKMENAFLKNQNNKLAQELDQCRLTIQALKNIVGQKDIALQNARSESQQAILQIRVLEALILSKHSKDGSIIVRSGGNNIPSVTSLLQEKETLKRKDIPRKPVPQGSDPPAAAPQTPQQSPQQTTTQPSLIQSPILHTSTDSSESSDELDLLPPPLPPKRINRHTRRWSIDFGTNNHLGNEIEESFNMSNMSSNITHITSSDDHTIISCSGTPSSSTIAPSNNHDLQRNLPRILRRRTGDIFQSLASCRPSSTKNGYDPSPPSTPSSERDSRDSEDSNESVINEKSTKRKKPVQQNISRFRKIFLR